jgi:DNA polymerase-3 subunit alpha
MVQTYVKVRNGEIEATYLHPKLKPILQETYGIILYQEQILEIVKELCGYSLGEADVLRRIIGKKKIDQMKPAVDKMIERGVEQGIPRNIMAQISDRIVTFALYGFNKGHSGAYGLVSYQTAYLKTHYPLQFMCATINSEENNQEKIVPYIDECKRLGIEILPPDVRYSNDEWVIEQ